MNNNNNTEGFSLLELSIVLVIIGLIAGGITVGADMVRAAELRKVLTQFSQFDTAVMIFKDKYMALPGDMKNATTFWGTFAGSCIDAVGTGTQTCNGDGDGVIDYDNSVSTNTPHESFRVWQHLSNAGLVEGNFTGASTTTGQIFYRPGLNVPSGPMSGSSWSVHYLMATWGWLPVTDGHFFVFAAPESGNGRWHYPVLRPEDQWSIDAKMDDGRPYQGNVTDISGGGLTPNCTTSETFTNAEYVLTTTSISCLLFMRASF